MSLGQDLKIIKNAELDIELLHRDNDKLCAENNNEIANLEEKIKSTEFIMEEELKVSKEDKIECKFDGYKGAIGWQKMPDKWTYFDDVLMAWIVKLPKRLSDLFLMYYYGDSDAAGDAVESENAHNEALAEDIEEHIQELEKELEKRKIKEVI